MPTLSDTAVRNAKPREKPYKISDGDGLYLLVSATGKYWRFSDREVGLTLLDEGLGLRSDQTACGVRGSRSRVIRDPERAAG